MQLRRVLPLSLVALLASAGCVSVGPQAPDVPARGSVPPADAPDPYHPADASDASGTSGTSGSAHASPAPDSQGRPAEPLALPLGKLPEAPGAERGAGRRAAKAPRPAAERRAKPAAPHRAHPPQKAPARPERPAAPAPRTDELCAAAEGALPPSIVDLCIRQAGR